MYGNSENGNERSALATAPDHRDENMEEIQMKKTSQVKDIR